MPPPEAVVDAGSGAWDKSTFGGCGGGCGRSMRGSLAGFRPSFARASDARLAAAIPGWEQLPEPRAEHVVGAFAGEGVGPEIVGAALEVLEAVADAATLSLAVRHGGPIGLAARETLGADLTPAAASFCVIFRTFSSSVAFVKGFTM